MRVETLRRYLVVHTWTGILSGLLLFVAFYAGGLSMFEPEITRWAQAGPSHADANPDADALVAGFLAGQPTPPRSFQVVFAGEGNPAPFLRYREGGRRDGAEHRVVLDADGGLRSLDDPPGEVGDFVDRIHRKGGLPLPLEYAEPIIGVVALVYALALVSGVIVLLPSLVRDLFALRITRNIKRNWLDLHNLVGITGLPFHIVMALTAAVFGLHDWIYDAQGALVHPEGMRPVIAASAPQRDPVPTDPSAWLPPSRIVAAAREASPGFEPVALEYRGVGTPGAAVHVAGTDDAHFKRSARVGYALMDPASGEVFRRTYLPGYGDSRWARALTSFFALHFGSYGGTPVRILYAVLGLLGAVLFYTGNMLWIESRTRRIRTASGMPEQPTHVRRVAALNVGVCLGSIAGLSMAIVAWRWLDGAGMAGDVLGNAVFFAVLVAAVVRAFRRGAAQAAIGLLGFAALACALVPLTSLVAGVIPHHWAPVVAKPYLPGFVFVDVLFTMIASVLAFLALRARRRPRRGVALPASPVLPPGQASRP